MSLNLTRNGIAGIELTREDVADTIGMVDALIHKAECREVNQIVLDTLACAREELDKADSALSGIIELWKEEQINRTYK